MPTITNTDAGALLIAKKNVQSGLEKGATQTLQTTKAIKKANTDIQAEHSCIKGDGAVGKSQRVSAKEALEARKEEETETEQQNVGDNKETLETQFEIVPTQTPTPAPFNIPAVLRFTGR